MPVRGIEQAGLFLLFLNGLQAVIFISTSKDLALWREYLQQNDYFSKN
jgi:hypothetical protein